MGLIGFLVLVLPILGIAALVKYCSSAQHDIASRPTSVTPNTSSRPCPNYLFDGSPPSRLCGQGPPIDHKDKRAKITESHSNRIDGETAKSNTQGDNTNHAPSPEFTHSCQIRLRCRGPSADGEFEIPGPVRRALARRARAGDGGDGRQDPSSGRHVSRHTLLNRRDKIRKSFRAAFDIGNSVAYLLTVASAFSQGPSSVVPAASAEGAASRSVPRPASPATPSSASPEATAGTDRPRCCRGGGAPDRRDPGR
jgi:hypothetical protein